MAAADTLQYYSRSAIPSYPYSPASITHPSSPASLVDFISPAQLAALQSQWTAPKFSHDAFTTPTSPVVPAGAIVATNFVSNHGKLHKRATQKSPRKKSKHDEPEYTSEIGLALTRTKTPPASAGVSPVDGPRSPTTRSSTRGILKQNLRKLSHHQDDNDGGNVIDLSRTAEENEERSGLGITTSRSVSDMKNPAPGYRGHSRSHSHNSQISTTSGPYQPTVPHTFSVRDPTRSETPPPLPLNRAYTTSIEGLDFAGDAYGILSESAVMRSRGATVDSSTSTCEQRPKLRLVTSAASTQLASQQVPDLNLSVISLDRTFTRPRRSTNQSAQSATDLTATPKTKGPADTRAFGFLPRPKPAESIDASCRAATIQAARQAFDDREEDKIRKYEEQEQRALSRQQRKIARLEERKRRKSDAATTSAATAAPLQSPSSLPSSAVAARSPYSLNATPDVPRRHDFASGGEYTSLESLPLPLSVPGSSAGSVQVASARAFNNAAEVSGGMTVVGSVQPPPHTSKRLAARTTYVQLVTWVRTKMLNVGRRRRRRHEDAE